MAQLQAMIDRTFPDKTNSIINRSRDGNRVLIFSSAADDPGTYYVFDRAARRMEVFASPYNGLVGHGFAPVRPISYRDRAGVTIHAYLTMPPGRPERDLPLVVLPHGGPFLRDSWAFDPQVQFLVSRGYAVLQPNFRGSTGYGRDFVQSGYGQYGGAMIDDMEDGIDALAGQGIADPARVCIMGSSYGGYAAIWGAMRSPLRYRCAISFAGPTDLRAMLRYDSHSFIPRRYVREFQQRLQGEERIDLDAVAPARHPELLHVPLLLAQGRRDPIVPPEQAQRLLNALQRVHAPVESVFFEKSGHGFTDSTEAMDFYRRVEAFLAAHNPTGTPPPAAAH
jgi:dipeptidyl aminopeptidase/acylaminoacyl peptidase